LLSLHLAAAIIMDNDEDTALLLSNFFLVGSTTPTIRLDRIATNPPYPIRHPPIGSILRAANFRGIEL
jgi:hypothetical protein